MRALLFSILFSLYSLCAAAQVPDSTKPEKVLRMEAMFSDTSTANLNDKNDAAFDLYLYYHRYRSNYKRALQYLKFYDSTYYLVIDCGNGYYQQKRRIRDYYIKCYYPIGDMEKVLDLMLPWAFGMGINFHFVKDDVRKLKACLLKKYSQQEIIEERDNAESTITVKQKGQRYTAFIKLFGRDVLLGEFEMVGIPTTSQVQSKAKEAYKASVFYKDIVL